MRTYTTLITTLVAIAASACGHADFQVESTWDPNESPFFDDGVDIIKEMKNLSGDWAYARKTELDGRIMLADLIALVEIDSVQTFLDIEGKEAKRVDIKMVSKLYGKAPSNQISLVSSIDAAGHDLIERYENYLSGKFYAFVRWFVTDSDDDLRIGHHFHLSPYSPELSEIITKGIQQRENEESEAEQRAKQR